MAWKEPQYLFGFHEPGGEKAMIEKGKIGWLLFTEAIGHSANDMSGSNYTAWSNQGFGIVVRVNHGYGSAGTIPMPHEYDNFARRCGNFVEHSQGAHIWIIGNEMNHGQERPNGQPITPQSYAECFKKCRAEIRRRSGHEQDLVVVGAVAPWNVQTTYPGNESGDWVRYFTDILRLLSGQCDGISIHTYTHGTDPALVFNDKKMDPPFQKWHYHFRAYQDFMNAIPADMRDLPVYITEADQDDSWADVNSGWVRNAYKEIHDWNSVPGRQQIRCLLLYRWPKYDKWAIDGKRGVIEDFKQAMDREDVWYEGVIAERVATFISHTMPIEIRAGEEVTATFRLRNAGSKTWVAGGNNPVRVGFHWYLNGQNVLVREDYRGTLPQDVAPRQEVTVTAKTIAPDTPGSYMLQWDLVEEGVTWFSARGSRPLELRVEVQPALEIVINKVLVKVPFLTLYTQLGMSVCGTPIAAETTRDGKRVQYFEKVAMEEYTSGRARLVEIGREAFQSQKTITDLQAQLAPLKDKAADLQAENAELKRQVELLMTSSVPVKVPRPDIKDITATLPVHATSRYETRSLDNIQYLVMHHSAVSGTIGPEAIAKWHVEELNWPGIGYHFVITPDGTIYQTNRLEALSFHARQVNPVSIGTCFAGNFTTDVPTPEQIASGAQLGAYLLQELGLTSDAIHGHGDFVNTQCPGLQWTSGKKWRDMLTAKIEEVQQRVQIAVIKPLYHYVLFWQHPEQEDARWAKDDWQKAINYIDAFLPTCGFSVDDAKQARYVTVIGGPLGVDEKAEQILRDAGCKVERIAGKSSAGTARKLNSMAKKGQRFVTPGFG
jgi:hypothetical protein